MCLMRASLFGRFEVSIDGEQVGGLQHRRVQELFCYLLLFRDNPHSRERMAEMLWGDCTSPQAKKLLRQALWQLRSAVRKAVDNCIPPVFLLEKERVRINPEMPLWLDVSQFESAYLGVQGLSGQSLTCEQARMLEDAAELYQGDLLDGCYYDWCLSERERFRRIYLAILDKLVSYCDVQNLYEAGQAFGERVLRIDRAREGTHRRLMRLHFGAGNRTEALRQYELCAAALEEELGVGPSSRTISLCEQIRGSRHRNALMRPVPTGSGMPAGPMVTSPGETLDRLCEMRRTLGELQFQLEREIEQLAAIVDGPR